MLIIGAKGLAKEVLGILEQRKELENLYFYDDISEDVPDKLYGQFTVLRNMREVEELFRMDKRFIIGIGNPYLRHKMYVLFKNAGGQLVSAISPLANIGQYGTAIGNGVIIMAGAVISNDVTVGLGCLINPNCSISHDTVIGEFVEISPGVQITGHCIVGEFCNIGTSATILPRVRLGRNVTVGAGAVVIRNVDADVTVAGVPAIQLVKNNE